MSSLYMLPSWDPLDISGGNTEENITKTGGSGRGGGEEGERREREEGKKEGGRKKREGGKGRK